MRKTAYIVLGVSLFLTVVSLIGWILGFAFAGAAVGNLIHLLLILAMITTIGVVVGAILLIVSYIKK